MTSRDTEIAELEDQLGWATDDHKESYELTVRLAAKVNELTNRLDTLRADETQWYMGHPWTEEEFAHPVLNDKREYTSRF